MSVSSFASTPVCFGRGGYNKDGSESEETTDQGRGGYNRGPDDEDDEE